MLLAAGQVSAQDDGRKAFCQPARLGREFPYLDAGVLGTRHMILWPFQVISGSALQGAVSARMLAPIPDVIGSVRHPPFRIFCMPVLFVSDRHIGDGRQSPIDRDIEVGLQRRLEAYT